VPELVQYLADGWGIGELWLENGRLLAHDLPTPAVCPSDGHDHSLAERMRRYFRGERVEFDDVELEFDGTTPYERALADALRAVPYGAIVTYGELAARAGRPRAHRAAGSFCAHNRFGLVVPCHRVVAAGGLGGYGSLGVSYKRRLLVLEGVRV